MPKSDITDKVQRLEAFEERAKVRIDAMSAFASEVDEDGETTITIRGELHSTKGNSIDEDIELQASVYDKDGRVIETGTDYVDAESFFGFHTFDISFFVDAHSAKRIRIIPKLR